MQPYNLRWTRNRALPWVLAVLLTELSADVAFAQTTVALPVCTCRNLESLQQEYQNAVYLEKYKLALAEHLRQVETAQAVINKTDPTNKNAGKPPNQASQQAGDAYERANLKLPFPSPKDYTGPSSVSLPIGECKQRSGDLEAMAKGSPCEAIADAALAHELAHSDICLKMGADAYWSRPPSEIALEEAEMYKIQAANLKAELRRVMDVSDLRLVGEFRTTLGAGGGGVTDEVTYDSGDLSLDSQGGERWTMSGTGSALATYVMQGGGEICTSEPVTEQISVSLKTDGLTFEVEVIGFAGKDTLLTCSAGVSLPYYSGDFGKRRASGLPVKAGDTTLPNENDGLMSTIIAGAAGAGVSMGDVQNSILRLTCDGQ